jgi:hypothetical protein
MHWRRTAHERALAVLAFIPAIVLATMFWIASAMDPLTAPALLIDRLLQFATLLWIPLLFAVVGAKPRAALNAVMFIAITGMLLSLSVFVAGIVRPPRDTPVLILSGIAVLGSGANLLRFGPRVTWLAPLTVKAAVGILTVGVGLLEFWNAAVFLPSQTEASLQTKITTAFDAAGLGMLSTIVSNETDSRVLVLITRLDLCYWSARTRIQYPPNGSELECQKYRPVDRQGWISSKSTLDWQVVLDPPEGAEKVSVRARTAFARGDRLRLSSISTKMQSLGTCVDIESVPIVEESRVKALAQEDKFLVYADRNGDGGVNYFFHSGELRDCTDETENIVGRDDPQDLAPYFGVTEQTIVYEAPLTLTSAQAHE